ncbi:NAD(P)-dependent oxidoreductase [Nocardioides pacificus]
MKTTILGATGPAGRLVVSRALNQGHTVTVHARHPDKLGDLAGRPGLEVVTGQLDDRASLDAAVAGADAVISVLGPGRDKASIPPLVPGMQNVVDAMTAVGVRRLVATSTPSATDPADTRDLRFSLMVTGIRLGAAPAYRAIVAMADIVRGSSLDWTLVRLPLLHDKPVDSPARPRQVGEPGGIRLSRAALADFLLAETVDGAWVRRSPLLADG